MSSRYEREIEELLKRMDGRRKSEPLYVRWRRRTLRMEAWIERTWRSFLRRSPVEQFMMASVLLTLFAYLLSLFSARAAFFAGLIAVVLFVLALILSVANHRGGGYSGERQWRGQTIDLPPHSRLGMWWWYLKRWWRKRR